MILRWGGGWLRGGRGRRGRAAEQRRHSADQIPQRPPLHDNVPSLSIEACLLDLPRGAADVFDAIDRLLLASRERKPRFFNGDRGFRLRLVKRKTQKTSHVPHGGSTCPCRGR